MNISLLTKEIALRQSADYYYRYLTALPDPDPILQRLGKGIEAYRELTTDPHLYAVIQQRKAGVSSLNGYIQGSTGFEKVFEQIFDTIDRDKVVTQILNAPLYGFTVLEILWKVKTINGRKWILPRAVEEKPQEWFLFDQSNQLRYRSGNHPEGILLPQKKFILVQNDAAYTNPYGEKALARCYWPVTFKKNGLEFWVLFTERYGLPFIVGKQPAASTEEDAAALLLKLEDMISSSAAVIPDNSSVDIISFPSGASIDAYRYFLEFMNSEISKAILTQTLTTEVQNRGSYAASQTHSDQLQKVHSMDARLVKKTMNKLISWIIEINGLPIPVDANIRFEFESNVSDEENRKKE